MAHLKIVVTNRNHRKTAELNAILAHGSWSPVIIGEISRGCWKTLRFKIRKNKIAPGCLI